LPTIEEGTWIPWNLLGYTWISTFPWWQVLWLIHLWWEFVQKYSNHILHLLFDLHIQLLILSLIVNKYSISKAIGYNDHLSYSSTMLTPCLQPIKEDIRRRFLHLWSNIKYNTLWDFFLHISKKKERNNFRTSQTSFLIMIANKVNSKAIPKSSSIKLTWASGFVTSSLHLSTW